MASGSIHYIPVTRRVLERLSAARKPAPILDSPGLKAAPYPAFSGQFAGADQPWPQSAGFFTKPRAG